MLSNNSEIVRWKPLDVVERLTWSRGVGDMGWRCRCEERRGGGVEEQVSPVVT